MTAEHPVYGSLITSSRVLDLHAEGIRRYQVGEVSAPRPGCVEQCLGNAYNAEAYAGDPAKGVGLLFAAYALFYLVKDHCFMDGNKRLGFLVAADILLAMGLHIKASEEEAYALVKDVAEGRITSAEKVAAWLGEGHLEAADAEE